MNKYFSLDSIIYTVISIMLVFLGNSFLLLFWMFLSIFFMLTKTSLTNKQKSGITTFMVFGAISGMAFWSPIFIAILLGCWIYIIYQLYFA